MQIGVHTAEIAYLLSFPSIIVTDIVHTKFCDIHADLSASDN
jgi:hypothetical protein